MVKTEKVGRIAVVTLDRPPGNLFNYRIYDGLGDAFSELGRDTDIDVIILKATGKNFTLGHDMEELQKVSPDNIDAHYRIVGEGLSAIYNCPKPTIAAAQGLIVGAGLAAVAACDIIIAADDAHFMTPEITAGIIGCTEFLELLLPKGLVRYYAYTGKPIPAYEVYRCGGVLKLVPAKELPSEAMAVAESLLQIAPGEELGCYKQYMNQIDANNLLEKFYCGKPYGKKFLRSPNSRELYRAFFEKRRPRFLQYSLDVTGKDP